MPFVISFAMSLLALTAGLFLLIKAKQDTGKFLRIMSWIIISCGMLAVLISLHLAVIRCAMHHHEKEFSKENYFFKDKLPFSKFIPFGDKDDDESSCADDKSGDVKVVVKKEITDDAIDPAIQANKIVKILSDNLKLTAEQEKKIKDEIEKSLSASTDVTPVEKEEAKESK